MTPTTTTPTVLVTELRPMCTETQTRTTAGGTTSVVLVTELRRPCTGTRTRTGRGAG
jgi:hypothetical protein